MKKSLLALSIFSTSALVAGGQDGRSQYQQNGDSSSCYNGACDPCCVPEPKKCIDCECYTPAYYDLQCDWGFFLTGDFLYWYARETNLSYAAVLTESGNYEIEMDATYPQYNLSSISSFGIDWEPGFRIGIGFNSSCDGWDMHLHWTYFRNSRSDKTTVAPITLTFPAPAPEGFVINPWVGCSLTSSAPHLNFELISDWGPFTAVSGKWSLRYNQIDLELGRKYWLSRCFTLRPYVGLRGQWAKTTMKLSSEGDYIEDFPNNQSSDTLKSTSKIWGGGFLGGIQPNWHFCSNFILYSNLAASLTWGKHETKHEESNLLEADAANRNVDAFANPTFSYSFYGMLATLDLGIGLRWEETWCCDRYRTALDLGWEHHLLFNANHRIQAGTSYAIASPTILDVQMNGLDYDEKIGTLEMGGFVLRLRFDF